MKVRSEKMFASIGLMPGVVVKKSSRYGSLVDAEQRAVASKASADMRTSAEAIRGAIYICCITFLISALTGRTGIGFGVSLVTWIHLRYWYLVFKATIALRNACIE